MAWVAVNTYGIENIYESEPYRESGHWWDDNNGPDTEISLPKGSIRKLIGRDLTWEDNPVELKEE